ncbi:MAG: hypothetical protein ACFWUE_00730 [Xylanivirga thermophila]|jgi:Na+-transporting methylmalonyl-CoA/oxaloacetate decarboxylase gamma subunit|nr:OadG family protein [Xylanivirga thermophila]
MNENIMSQTLKIMGTGMGTVFLVLFLFYALVKLLTRLFPYRESDECKKE